MFSISSDWHTTFKSSFKKSNEKIWFYTPWSIDEVVWNKHVLGSIPVRKRTKTCSETWHQALKMLYLFQLLPGVARNISLIIRYDVIIQSPSFRLYKSLWYFTARYYREQVFLLCVASREQGSLHYPVCNSMMMRAYMLLSSVFPPFFPIICQDNFSTMYVYLAMSSFTTRLMVCITHA